MNRPVGNRVAIGDDGYADLVLWAMGIGVVGVALAWAGATLATVLTGGGFPELTAADTAQVLTRLPGHLGEPALAWPEPARARMPGPVAYWGCHALLLAAVVALALLVARGGVASSDPDRARSAFGARPASPGPPTCGVSPCASR
jgi:hypothetical protein